MNKKKIIEEKKEDKKMSKEIKKTLIKGTKFFLKEVALEAAAVILLRVISDNFLKKGNKVSC